MTVLPWILFIFAAIAAVIAFLGQNEPKKQLADAEAKLRDAEAALETAKKQKQPVAVAAGGPAVPVPPTPVVDTGAIADLEKRLNSSLGEIKRLETAVTEAEKRAAAEREKVEAANTRVATAEAMVAQARSRTAEAGHTALLDAKKETDAVRAQLADTEKRLKAVAEGEKKLADLVTAAKNAEARLQAAEAEVKSATTNLKNAEAAAKSAEANARAAEAKLKSAEASAQTAETTARTATERARAMEAEAATLRTQLAQVEASTTAAEKAKAEAVQIAEKTQREQYAIQLHKARTEWEEDTQNRIAAERERWEAETKRLAAELEEAKRAVVTAAPAPVATPEAEPEIIIRRPRPTTTRVSDITGEAQEKPLVILADSDANIQKTLTKHLEDGGYAVRTASTVADAVDAARTANPAAVAVDAANLPDGDCWKVLTTLKEDSDLKEIPVIVFAPGKDKERALEMGAAGCFSKPIDKAVLVATIKAAMVKRKQRARLAAVTGGNGAARRSSLLTAPSE